MAKLLDETALGARPLPDPAGGIARYRAEIPDAEAPGLALMAAGRTLDADAEKMFAAYKAEQAKVDTLRAEDAYTQLQTEKLKRTYGPGGYATRRGENAVLGPTIENEMTSFDDLTRKVSNGLANDDQKRMFQHRANIARQEYQEGNLRHRFQERNVWATDVTNSGVDSALANISAIYSTPNMDPQLAANQASAELVRARSLIEAHSDDLGMSKTKIDNAMTKVVDQAITKKLLGWSSWDPVGAFENFKTHQTELSDPAHRLTLRNTLWERALPSWVGVEADGLINKARKDAAPPASPTQGEDTFRSVVGSLLKREGGYVAKDGKGGAPANRGINQAANPDIDVKNLTEAGAIKIYKERYWDEIGGADLAPATALVALDTAALQGVGVAKALLASTGGDPQAMIDARRQQLQGLAARDPEHAKNLPAWMARLDSLQAEVAAMPDGGLRKVSATDRALAPNTSPLPTARNIAAQLPIALAGVEKRATELFGANRSDPDRSAFVVRLEQELRARNLHDTQLVQNQQREALQTVGNIVSGFAPGGAASAPSPAGGMMPAGGGTAPGAGALQKITSHTQMMANPEAAAAYQLLDFDGKRAVDTLIRVNGNQSEHGDPALANELRNSITDGKIKWAEDLLNDPRVRAGNLNSTQLNFLQSQLRLSASEGGRSQMATVNDGIKYAAAYFNDPNSVIKLSGKAPTATYLFTLDAQRAVDKFRKDNPTKDIQELFDPRSQTSLLTEQNLRKYGVLSGSAPTTADALAQQAAAARAGAPAAPPVAAPATLKTADEVSAWIATLPANVTHFTDPGGTVRAIPGRAAAAPAAAPAAPGAAFNPEGTGYDMESARKAGLQPDANGHWPSRDPKTGLLLKGAGHETWSKTIEGEKAAGMEVKKGPDGRYYSQPAVKPKGAVPEFGGSINEKSPEYLHQHVANLDLGAVGYALKETGKAALHALNPMTAGRQIMDLYFAGVEKLRDLPPAARRESARAYFEDILKKPQFFKEDVPAIQEAVKYGDLSVADRKKAKAMLKAAGAD